MCDEEDKSSCDSHIYTPLCEGNIYGYCSYGDLITNQVILNYRDCKGHHYTPKEISVNFCKTHYEWIKQINNNKFPKDIYGYDEHDAIGETLCYDFETWNYNTHVSNIYTFFYNKETRKVILINEHVKNIGTIDNVNNVGNVKIPSVWEKKGSFHYDGRSNNII